MSGEIAKAVSRHAPGEEIVKKPGCPCIMAIHELVAIRALGNTSPLGVKRQILRSVTRSEMFGADQGGAWASCPQ
jgi:hypothetical protein